MIAAGQPSEAELERLLARVLTEDQHGDRSYFDGLSLAERDLVVAIMRELIQEGESINLRRLWEVDYQTQPLTPEEFLADPEYMGTVGRSLFPIWKRELSYVLDPQHEIFEWILGGAIGIGKTTAAVLAQVYKLYHLQCLWSPTTFFGLAPGSEIVIGFFNIFKHLAESVAYKKFVGFCEQSPWLRRLVADHRDREGKRRRVDPLSMYMLWPKNIRIGLGASVTHALGQDLIGGLMDETDFGKPGQEGEEGQVQTLYAGARSRIDSRFLDGDARQPGLLCLCSSARLKTDFSEQHKQRRLNDPHTHVTHHAIWEAKEQLDSPQKFVVALGCKGWKPRILEADQLPQADEDIIEVPETLRQRFVDDLQLALRDQAGIPADGAFLLISDMDPVYACEDSRRKLPWATDEVSVGYFDSENNLIERFLRRRLCHEVDEINHIWRPKYYPSVERFVHLDIAEAPGKNRYGLAMICRPNAVPVERPDDEGNTVKIRDHAYFYDFLVGLTCPSGDRIDLQKVREFLIWLRDKLGYPITHVSTDGYQSTDTRQILGKLGFKTSLVSVDRDDRAYVALRRAFREGRVSYPRGCGIFLKELKNLRRYYLQGKWITGEVKTKVDHPRRFPDGTIGGKDIADGAAGALFNASGHAGVVTMEGAMIPSQLLSRLSEHTQAAQRERAGLWAAPELTTSHGLDRLFED